MEIKINIGLLDKQMQLLDTYASIITDKYYKELVDGVINLLDKISWVVKEGEEVTFIRFDEV